MQSNDDSNQAAVHRLVGLNVNVDILINWLESLGCGWSLDHTGHLIEARVWAWPIVIGRNRPNKVAPLAEMLYLAMKEAHIDMPDEVKYIEDMVAIRDRPPAAKQDTP